MHARASPSNLFVDLDAGDASSSEDEEEDVAGGEHGGEDGAGMGWTRLEDEGARPC